LPSGPAAAVHHRGVAVSPGHSREQRGQRDPSLRHARPRVVRRPRRSASRSSMPATSARISRHCSRRAGL